MGSATGGLAVVIPARLGSTRFPGKLLRKVAGRSVLEWTWSRARCVEGLSGIWIATDSEEIAAEAANFGGSVLHTGSHPSGTDRVGAAVDQIAPRPQWVVNLQGDEPLVDPGTIASLCDALRRGKDEVITCATALRTYDEWVDPAVVKVVCAADGQALYFSRAPIPASAAGPRPEAFEQVRALARAHIGIYGYPAGLLQRLLSLPPSPLERAESLEQLRALEAAIPIRVLQVEDGGCSIDTPEDLLRVQAILEAETENARGPRLRGQP